MCFVFWCWMRVLCDVKTVLYRCQGNEKRLRLNLRSTEGEYGDMEVTISTAKSGTSVKSAKTIKVELKPLSLHSRISCFSPDEEKRPRHVLKCTGKRFRHMNLRRKCIVIMCYPTLLCLGNSLQAGMISTWVQTIFPDVPQKLVSDDDVGTAEHTLFYRNVFSQAVAKVQFRSREVGYSPLWACFILNVHLLLVFIGNL